MIIRVLNCCVFILFFNISASSQLFESLFTPEKYVVFRCSTPPKIDGIINDSQWEAAKWTEDFVNIEGRSLPKPKYNTKVKMLWDSKNLYIAAILYDKHIWAEIKKPESAMFEDNDFEVLIDPNGDTHDYLKFEINALGTYCDLYMDKPLRDGGIADVDWNFEGLKSAVKVYGKINRTTGKDSCWTVELVFPFKSMTEFSNSKKIPIDGEKWRVNFVRVQWNTSIKDFEYKKDKGPNGKPLPEMNWVWSPQNSLNIHQPETWGYIQFSTEEAGSGIASFVDSPDENAIWSLWQVYYLFQLYPHNLSKAEESLQKLKDDRSASKFDFRLVELGSKKDNYLARVPNFDKSAYWFIRKDGKVWCEQIKK